MEQLDFDTLGRDLLDRARELLPMWLPSGKFRGHEYVVGNLAGEAGESLSINVNTGRWSDFATGEKGGDLISLYAAINRIGQADAAKQLGAKPLGPPSTRPTTPRPADKWHVILPVPDDAPKPPNRKKLEVEKGQWVDMTFVQRWAYVDAQGQLLGYVVRFKRPDGGKEVVPQTWCRSAEAPDKFDWKWKSLPQPRPLYGLDLLARHADRPVLVVEGEKAADAARKLAGATYVVITWPGGGKALQLADLRPLHGRKLLLWPDADEPGRETMRKLAAMLHAHCPEIKLLDVAGQPDAWDAADALAEGWDYKRLLEWARPRAAVYKPADVVDLNAKRREKSGGAHEGDAPVSPYGLWEQLQLDLNHNGAPIANLSNVLKVFEHHPELAGVIRYDEFHNRYFHKDGHEWGDVDELQLAAWIQRACRFRNASPVLVHQAAIISGMRHVTNEPRDWMETLRWDGVPRISHFFSDALGSVDSPYIRAASRNFWLGMVKRVYAPGCRLRNVVVLEGKQDKGKSFALAKIGGPWYAEASESVMSKDFYLAMQGKFLIEIAELDAFSRADIRAIKRIISIPIDRFRAPYARSAQDYPRRCIFTGTTNEDAYLGDVTGGTRFWPVPTNEIRLDLIDSNRAQLFAESVAAIKAGEAHWHMPVEATRAAQESRRQHDEWEEVVADYLIGKREVRLQDVLVDALRIDVAKQDRLVQRRAADVMRVLGWRRDVAFRGKTRRVWVRDEGNETG